MGIFGDFFDKKKKKPDDDYEYYEDTHNGQGEYTARLKKFQQENMREQQYNSAPAYTAPRENTPPPVKYEQSAAPQTSPFAQRDREKFFGGRDSGFNNYNAYQSAPAFNTDSLFSGTRGNKNVMVYEPKSADDVQTLIDFLKTKEPAIINLDDVDEEVSQRVLDFVSGAIYALSGSVHRIAGNIFLLSPEGVEITIPYDMDDKNGKK